MKTITRFCVRESRNSETLATFRNPYEAFRRAGTLHVYRVTATAFKNGEVLVETWEMHQ